MVAFYLRYRPQSLDDLIGQDSVKKTLIGAFRENKLSHAYLLVGPRGTGKTSTARIIAKMVNCEGKGESGKGEVPCNKCDSCISITDGSNMDLIEIDAASNRGIEDIRDLREKIKLAPTSSLKKVYIIDEVHMLTPEAFNALLKTLEEPPAHVLFILATTDVQKLPQTILSRVQRLDFKLAKPQEVLEVLQRIANTEKIDIDDKSLKLLVKKAEGSFRDGVKYLDQVSSLGEKITEDILQKSIQLSNFEVILQIIKGLIKKDISQVLSLVIKQSDAGIDPKQLTLALMESLRNIVFIKNGLGEQIVKDNFLEEDYSELVKLANDFSSQELISSLDILQKAYQNLKFSSIPSLPLELAMVEICDSSASVIPSERSERGNLDLVKIATVRQEIGPRNDKKEELVIEVPVSNTQHPTANDDILKLKEKWTFVLETIRPYNFSLEALLRSTNIKECTDTTLIMEVPYSFHQRILEAPKNRDLLESILSDILGRSIRLSTVLGVRIQRAEDIANIEVAADDEIIRAAAEIFSSDTIN